MKIYLISQHINRAYDTYDSAVVVAENEEEARLMHPDDSYHWNGEEWKKGRFVDYSWAHPKDVIVQEIPLVNGVVLGSFNAG